jgi:hypothetical protein
MTLDEMDKKLAANTTEAEDPILPQQPQTGDTTEARSDSAFFFALAIDKPTF